MFGLDDAAKGGELPNGRRVVIKPGTFGERLQKNAVRLKCVPADAFYRDQAALGD
jgi:hypothetical protein